MTTTGHIEVAVLLCSHQGHDDLNDCLGSLFASKDADLHTHIVFVDNGSTDGSGDLMRQRFPQADYIRSVSNRGFTGGNNLGWQHVRQSYPNVRYIVLLNVDTIVQSGYLRTLVDCLEAHPHVGAAQAKLMLHPDTDRINSAGNRSHYLGFGYLTGYGEKDQGQYDRSQSIDYASGAAVIIRAELLEQFGLFDEIFYLHLEDTDLSWKLRQVGFDTFFVPDSVVYHKYQPDAPIRYYYYLERNRWILLFTYYRLPTLILLAPALLFMELGQLAFSCRHGKFGEKLRCYGYFMKPSNMALIWRRRCAAQKRRTIGDQQFMTRFSGTIRFETIDSPLLRLIGNPLLGAYWTLVRPLIFW